MKPAAFDFIRVHSLAEASRNLKEAGGSARLVAGGQSLGPMLNWQNREVFRQNRDGYSAKAK
jgi:CO/xanthine dehydrogenase FAD-binding subunit